MDEATSPRGVPSPRCFDLRLEPFTLEAGFTLPRLHLSGWWWGPASDLFRLEQLVETFPAPEMMGPRAPGPPKAVPEGFERLAPDVPTVLLIHALTGDARAGGPGGWWAPVVGPGRPLDPTRTRLVCFNNLGGCYGSFGANARDWPWTTAPEVGEGKRRPGLSIPAPVTTWDQARALLRALDALGLSRIRVALGGSLGGMLVLSLGALAPERFEQLIPVAASEDASAWIIGLNHVARQVILLDPGWPQDPARGLSIARQIAQMTYRAEPGLTDRQGRLLRPPHLGEAEPFTEIWSAALPYAQETYLEHQGRKLVERFEAASYLTQLAAMDHHDIDRRPPEPDPLDRYTLGTAPWSGRDRLPRRIDAVGIDTDVLYSPVHMRALGSSSNERRYHEIRSPHGHDAFLIEWEQLDAILRAAGAPFDGVLS